MVLKVISGTAAPVSSGNLLKTQILWLFPDQLSHKFSRVMPSNPLKRNIPGDADAHYHLRTFCSVHKSGSKEELDGIFKLGSLKNFKKGPFIYVNKPHEVLQDPETGNSGAALPSLEGM